MDLRNPAGRLLVWAWCWWRGTVAAAVPCRVWRALAGHHDSPLAACFKRLFHMKRQFVVHRLFHVEPDEE